MWLEGSVFYESLLASRTLNQYIVPSPFNLIPHTTGTSLAVNFMKRGEDFVPNSKFIIEECYKDEACFRNHFDFLKLLESVIKLSKLSKFNFYCEFSVNCVVFKKKFSK